MFRLSHMGDVALTTGVLSHWHEKSGDRFIFITRAGSAPLLENHPAVAEIIRLDDTVLKAWTGSVKPDGWQQNTKAIG